MAVSKKQQASVNKYVKENYDRILVTTPKGKRVRIKDHANDTGESVNGFINRAIDETMERDIISGILRYESYFSSLLERDGIELHKERDELGRARYYFTDDLSPDRPSEDSDRWFSYEQLAEFCQAYKDNSKSALSEQKPMKSKTVSVESEDAEIKTAFRLFMKQHKKDRED